MKKQIRLLLALIGFAVLLGGAYMLYNIFSQSYAPQTNLVVEEATGSLKPSETETSTPQSPDTEEAPAETEDEKLYPAPDFTVEDGEGNRISLSDMQGKPVVLNFWASWCPPCRSEMGDFEEVYLASGEELTFMMVNMTDGVQETVEDAQDFIAGQGYTFPVYYDTAMEAAYAFSVSSIPATYFIDADGNLIAHAKGAIDAQTLQLGIGMITE